ncbi:dihydrodipicolinate synthase family protein, partial [Dyadobacter sp.]
MPLDQRFKGVGAALITPFDQENEVDYTGLKKLIDLVSEGGSDYLVVQGTTGESPTVSSREKREILAFTI